MKLKQIFLMTKRLFKKPTFILLLMMIPVIALSLRAAEKNEGGFLNIKLAVDGTETSETEEIFQELIMSSKLINFEVVSVKEAIEAVKMGRADSAWIFPSDIQKRIDTFSQSRDISDYIVTVYEREPNLVLQLVHEKLSGTLYSRVSERIFINYLRDNVPELEKISDETLFEKYYSYGTIDTLFEFSYPDGSDAGSVKTGYMTAPLRGLLGIVVVLAALSGTMYYIEDVRAGRFFKVKPRAVFALEFFSVFICSFSAGIFTAAALCLSGLSGSYLRELFLVLFLSVSSTLFSMVIKRLFFSKIKIISTVSPLLVCVMAIVCPVFVDMASFRALQMIFPVTYYINSSNNNHYFIKNLIYIAFLILLILLLFVIEKIFEKHYRGIKKDLQ